MAKTVKRAKELTEVSEAQIAVHWKEEAYYQPSEKFKAQANLRDPHVFDRFGLDKFTDCFREYADMLTWFEPYHTVLDTSDAPFWKWFAGGKINASYNCVDRHLAKHGNKAAFIFVPEPEAERDVVIKYQELSDRVNEVAAMLRGLGLKAGDRVTFHMPMVPELPITMLACARLGIIHSQVFGGFSGQACGSRIQDSGSRVLITVDGYWRNGTLVDHKVNADIAVRTGVLYDGVPTFPDARRPWRMGERLGVNIFHTAPTAVRMLRKLGPEEPRKYKYHFKSMTTVGEPIEPEAWRWYYDEVGKREAVITDTWWMTETGGFLGTTVPAIHAMKPGSCGPAAPGIHPVIYDETGAEISKGSGKAGNMCIRNPWPGIMQTIWGDHDRYVKTYYGKYNKHPRSKDWRDWPFLCGDGAVQAADGYYRILGRIDDVINVAGHRLGTKEIESACLTVPEIAEAAVVPVQDELKGRVPEVYVALKPGVPPSQAVIDRVVKANEEVIGKIARPKHVYIVPDMPKTRSGKIMRRVLAAISNRRDVGDVTTLANPDVVEQIRAMVQGKDTQTTQEALPEDIAKFGQVE